jgi:hypothetical protein
MEKKLPFVLLRGSKPDHPAALRHGSGSGYFFFALM